MLLAAVPPRRAGKGGKLRFFGPGRPEPACSPGPLIVLRNEWGESLGCESRDPELFLPPPP